MDNVSNTESAQQLNRTLEERYTEIAQLAGALAHEIKNPLSTIKLNMELLAEDFSEEPWTPRERRAIKKLEMMQRETERLQDLLEDFLSFTKVRTLRLVPTNLNAVIEELLDFFQPTADEKNIEVIRYLDAELPSVMLDAEAFRAALLNLVLNAQQAMPGGGEFVVRTVDLGKSVAVHLIDTGSGFDLETGSRIFQAFFSTKQGGSGLGLPTTAKIIEAHGGRISVQSEVGHGTQFTIELPLAARLPSSASKEMPEEKIIQLGPSRTPPPNL